MPQPIPNTGVCPIGTVPITASDGSVQCWDPTEPGYPGPPAQGGKPEPNPRSPGGGGQPTPTPIGRPPSRNPLAPVGSGTARPFPATGPINVWLPPTLGFTSSGGTTVSQTGSVSAVPGSGLVSPTIVNVDQAVTLADNSANSAIQSVTGAIQGAIIGAANAASLIASNTQGDISGALSDIATSLETGVNDAFANIGSVLQGVESGLNNTLGGIGTTIGNNLFELLNPITHVLSGIAVIIQQQIGGLAGNIAAAVANVIPAIVGAVTGSLSPMQATLASIEGVLREQLGTLAANSGSVANSLGSLQVTLDTVLKHYEGFVENTSGYPAGGTLHNDLSGIIGAIAGLVLTGKPEAAAKLSDYITVPCGGAELRALLDSEFQLPVFEAGSLNQILTAFLQRFAKMFLWGGKLLPALKKYNEIGKQQLDVDCPTDLLPMSEMSEAVYRGLLPLADAELEVAKGDITASRFKIFRDNRLNQMAPPQLVEARYRGIISDADFRSALKQQAWTDGQIDTLTSLGVALLPVATLQELFRRQIIDAPTLDNALKAHQLDPSQRTAIKDLSFRPPNMGEALEGGVSVSTLSQMGLHNAADPGQIPEYVQVAAANEGLDVDTMNQRWFSHWSTGSFGAWIQLYFRGLVSLEALQAAGQREFIPTELITTIVEASRPLLQFRTIASLLRLGLIDVQTAGRLLLKHGYSQEDAQYLITYAQRPGAVVAAKKAQALHAVSLGIAKREYIDGAITETEYYQILLQHGFTVDGANAEIAVERANQAMLTRKANAQLVVDEYGAGLINEQTALAQLASLGLTVYELAKYAHRIKVFRVKNGKVPSEAELNNFRKSGIIDDNQYKAQLIAQHYSSEAAGWFLEYRTQAAQPTQQTTTPAPTP